MTHPAERPLQSRQSESDRLLLHPRVTAQLSGFRGSEQPMPDTSHDVAWPPAVHRFLVESGGDPFVRASYAFAATIGLCSLAATVAYALQHQ